MEGQKFDEISGIHDLLLEQLKEYSLTPSQSAASTLYQQNLPITVIPQRKSSITTGILILAMLS